MTYTWARLALRAILLITAFAAAISIAISTRVSMR